MWHSHVSYDLHPVFSDVLTILGLGGRWFTSIVDDLLFLENPQYDAEQARKLRATKKSPLITEDDYEQLALTGSRSLYFASSSSSEETFVPLLEKAYARAHGDYGSIQSMYVGDILEDITGGVTMDSTMSGILYYEQLWETMQKIQTGDVAMIVTPQRMKSDRDSQGGVNEDLVSIMRCTEYRDESGKALRLLLLRYTQSTTWRWNGAWSDGSMEWDPSAMKALDHRFGDDDVTWISYNDLVFNFETIIIHRTFDTGWQSCQIWVHSRCPGLRRLSATPFVSHCLAKHRSSLYYRSWNRHTFAVWKDNIVSRLTLRSQMTMMTRLCKLGDAMQRQEATQSSWTWRTGRMLSVL